MTEQWFVRVSGKEYGPVDYDTLLEWKSEGRLLAQNEVRASDSADWGKAGNVPGLFAPPPLPETAPQTAGGLAQRRTLSRIIADSFRLYRKNFWCFLILSLLIGIPLFAFGLAAQPAYGVFPGSARSGLTPANLLLLLAVVTFLIDWPIFLAGIQFATVAGLENRKLRLRDLFRRAVNYFARFARLSMVVYGNFFFCFAIPLLAVLTLVNSPSLAGIALALFFLCLQVVWFSYLWVNYLFWQQSAALSNLDGLFALRESRLLASSKRRPRWSDRPLWRGAFLISLWIVIWLVISAAAELPVVYARMQNITSLEEAIARSYQLLSAAAPDPVILWSGIIGAIVQTLLRPLLGIAFVLLYYDARTDFTQAELTPPPEP